MAKDKNNKKKNSFIKKAANFALVGAMLAGSGTSNLMAGNDPISVSGASTTNNIGGFVVTQGEHNLDGISVDVSNLSSSKPAIGIDLGSAYACVSYFQSAGVKFMKSIFGPHTSGQVKLGLEQIDEMSDSGKALFTKCATQLFDNYRYMQELISKNGEKIVKDGITISVTCKDSIQGAQRDCLKEAMKDVFRKKIHEATGKEVSNIECIVTPQSAAAEIAYARQLFVAQPGFSGKIVTVNCGHSGFSICGGEMNNGQISLHTDVYSSGCSGAAIDNAILELLQKRCDDAGLGNDFKKRVENDKNQKVPKFMKAIENAKCLLSSKGGQGSAFVGIDFLDDNDIDDITRDELDGILKEKGILGHFETTFKDYVQSKLGGIGEGDMIVLTGGSTRYPSLQNLIKTASGGAKICTDINADETPAYGAVVLAGCELSKVAEKA